MLFSKTFCLAVIFSFSIAAIAQNKSRSISGKLTDAQTGLPLAGASVHIEDAKLGVITDAGGAYVIKNIPLGHHLIEFSYAGYSTEVKHVDVNNDIEVNAALGTAVIEYRGVTVTGVSNATSIRKSPIPVTSIQRAELLHQPFTNIVDAISKQAGVSQVSTGPAISKPVIRGLGGNRVVVINDGVRQEGQQWGEEHGLEMDDASIQRVEILKGPASLTYGSDALAGVINLITSTPAPEGTIRGNVLLNYQTNNHLSSTHASLGGNEKGFNWNVYGTLKSAADYKNKYDGRVLNSRFNEKNYGGYIGLNRNWGYSRIIYSSFNQKLGIVEGDRDDVTGKFLIYAESPLEKIASEDDLKERDPQTPFQKIDHQKIVLDNVFNISGSRLKLNAGFQKNKRKEFGNPEDLEEAELFFDLKTLTYNLSWTLPEMSAWRTSFGLNGLSQDNKNKGEEVIIPNYRFNDIGFFVFTQGSFEKYTLSGGARFDNRFINSSNLMIDGSPKFQAFKKHYSNFSGSAGISYEPNNIWTLKANVGTGFRAPNMAELASNGAHEGTSRYEYGSQNLKSEKSVQVDGEVDINNEHLTLSVNGFYNSINNFIFYRKLTNTLGSDSIVVQDNESLTAFQFSQNNARLYGFEVSFDLHPHPLDWLHFENRLSFVRGQFTNDLFESRNLPLMPAPRWITELRADFDKVNKSLAHLYLRFEADNNFKQNNPFAAYDTETETPSYTLLNAGIGTDLVKKGKSIFSIHFAANNIADKAYQNHLSRLKYADINEATGRRGVFNAGRNFSLKLNVPLSFSSNKRPT